MQWSRYMRSVTAQLFRDVGAVHGGVQVGLCVLLPRVGSGCLPFELVSQLYYACVSCSSLQLTERRGVTLFSPRDMRIWFTSCSQFGMAELTGDIPLRSWVLQLFEWLRWPIVRLHSTRVSDAISCPRHHDPALGNCYTGRCWYRLRVGRCSICLCRLRSFGTC